MKLKITFKLLTLALLVTGVAMMQGQQQQFEIGSSAGKAVGEVVVIFDDNTYQQVSVGSGFSHRFGVPNKDIVAISMNSNAVGQPERWHPAKMLNNDDALVWWRPTHMWADTEGFMQ